VTYIIYKDKLYIIGKASDILKFINEKAKIHRTFKELIDFEKMQWIKN